MILGMFLIAIGAVFLLKNLGVIVLPASFWSVFYPVVLIVIGANIAIAAQRMRKYKKHFIRRYLMRDDEQE